MKRMFFFSTLVVLLAFASQSFALYNVMDEYAVEVLLNKPDIIHNLDFMKYAENMSIQENTVTYRSNFDSRIAVILESVNHIESLNGLSVRLQMPLREDATPCIQSIAKFKGARINDAGEKFLASLGYEVNIAGMGVVDGNYGEEPVMERPEIPMPVDVKPFDIMPVSVEEVAPTPFEDEVVVIAGDGASDGKPSVDDPAYRLQSIFLNKGNIGWSIIQYDNMDGGSVDFILNISGADTISDEARKDYQQMLEFYGLEKDERDQLGDNMLVLRSIDLVPDMNLGAEGFNFQSAMRTELDWLRRNGIVVGITDQDIAGISGIAKQGMAGWNSRIAYSEGVWLPYSETADPTLIRILEDATADKAIGVPDGMVVFPTASVSPGGKSITQWGRIKGGF